MSIALHQYIFVFIVIIVNSYSLIFLLTPAGQFKISYDTTSDVGRIVTYIILAFAIIVMILLTCFCFYVLNYCFRKNRILPGPPARNPADVEFELHEINAANVNQNMGYDIV